ncbi:hypothetical protein TNCV_2119601 [Trichonephila clavipes]|nr:hypothetical protein TNCV_2119601 [Trichonephila clavipes]
MSPPKLDITDRNKSSGLDESSFTLFPTTRSMLVRLIPAEALHFDGLIPTVKLGLFCDDVSSSPCFRHSVRASFVPNGQRVPVHTTQLRSSTAPGA